MTELAQIVGFRFRLVPVWDGQFGYRGTDGNWNGIIGEVLRKVRGGGRGRAGEGVHWAAM